MKLFQIGDRTVAIIDGELFERLLPMVEAAPSNGEPAPVSEKKRRGRPRGLGVHRMPHKRRPGKGPYGGYGGLLDSTVDTKGRLQQEDLRRMKELIVAGESSVDVAKQFGVNVSYVYQLKCRMKKAAELKTPDVSEQVLQ